MMQAVTTGKRVGRREASVSGTSIIGGIMRILSRRPPYAPSAPAILFTPVRTRKASSTSTTPNAIA